MQDNLELRRTIAEDILGDIDWDSDHAGTCECPGASRHTNPGESARVFVDGCPTLSCLHHSCSAEVASANEELREQIRAVENDPDHKYVPSEADRKRWEQQKRDKRQEMRARANLPAIVDRFRIEPEAWRERSPIQLGNDDVENDWRRLLRTLPETLNVWIGRLTDSGHRRHAEHFRAVAHWLLDAGSCPGPHICPAHFTIGAFSRCDASVLYRNIIVAESDTLSKSETGAIFQWLMSRWHLFAIVDTGGKSLHGWFELPRGLQYESYRTSKIVLKGLGCDPAMFRDSQPCRLPGWRREETGRWQRLLYLDTPSACKRTIPHLTSDL